MYLKGMEGVLSVADLSRPATFEGLKSSISHIKKHAVGAPMVFLLNKSDIADPTSVELGDIMSMADELGIPLLATSAKTGMNVENAFERLSEMIIHDWAANRTKEA
jgi:50S ribosomal subunit-associated GTPase HflX